MSNSVFVCQNFIILFNTFFNIIILGKFCCCLFTLPFKSMGSVILFLKDNMVSYADQAAKKQNKTKYRHYILCIYRHRINIYIYIYIRGVTVNVLTHAINLKILAH